MFLAAVAWANTAGAGSEAWASRAGAVAIGSISDSGIFERMQHFKDVGIPATVGKPLAQACISMAACMLFDRYPSGFFNLAHSEKVFSVVEAIQKLPSSNEPSHMVLTAKTIMPKVCAAADAGANDLDGFSFGDLRATLDNWQRALCAGPDEPSWAGKFDPAYQPQQQALTLGLTCSFACELAAQQMSADALRFLASDPSVTGKFVAAYCINAPWKGRPWAAAKDIKALARVASSLGILESPCNCKAKTI